MSSKSLKQIRVEREHNARHSGVTMEQLGEAMLRTAEDMDKDQKAIFRARLLRSVGLIKSSEGKPS